MHWQWYAPWPRLLPNNHGQHGSQWTYDGPWRKPWYAAKWTNDGAKWSNDGTQWPNGRTWWTRHDGTWRSKYDGPNIRSNDGSWPYGTYQQWKQLSGRHICHSEGLSSKHNPVSTVQTPQLPSWASGATKSRVPKEFCQPWHGWQKYGSWWAYEHGSWGTYGA